MLYFDKKLLTENTVFGMIYVILTFFVIKFFTIIFHIIKKPLLGGVK